MYFRLSISSNMLRTAVLSRQLFSCTSPFKEVILQRWLHKTSYNLDRTSLQIVKEKTRSVEPDPRPAKMKMEPYVKNLFKGKIDPNIFGFLEIDLGFLNVVTEMSAEIEKFMNGRNARQGKITSEDIREMNGLGLFQANIPRQYGGLGLTCMEMIRIGEELSKDPSLFQTLNVHWHYVSNLLCKFATEEQKQKYLPPLASGELQMGFALWEQNAGVDISALNTTADFHGEEYIISGKKRWVCNGGIADKYLVFASEQKMYDPNLADGISCFIVDKNAPGITAKSMDTLGMDGYNLWEVEFDKTPVPKENLVGNARSGIAMFKYLLHGNFTLMGASTGILKDLINTTVHHTINRETFGKPLIKYELVKKHLAEAACRLYALESIAYMTADIYDNIEDPDMAVEAAIVKLYASETYTWIVQKCLSLLGADSYLKDKPYEKMLRDALYFPLVDVSADALKMSIALQCLVHVGSGTMKERVIERRNPLYYPATAIKTFLFSSQSRPQGFSDVVFHHTHPSLEQAAKDFETAVLDCSMAVEEALVLWGKELDNKQMCLERIADMAVLMYTSTAVLARSSRALSTGARFSHIDGNMAGVIVSELSRRAVKEAEDLDASPYGTNDATFYTIGDAILHERKYHADHPLTRPY